MPKFKWQMLKEVRMANDQVEGVIIRHLGFGILLPFGI
jgi:hypothetical protein